MEGTANVTPECSVVVPLCNEERTLPTMHLRLTATMRRLAIPYEIIYIDDGSTDRTPALIAEFHEQDPSVRAIFLSRNFGHQAALCAGIESAAGRAVITIDGDLQDPPEVIPELLAKWHEGYHVVYARRRRRRENPVKRLACYGFYRLLKYISELPIPLDTGDFALMDREALTHLNALPERSRFVRGLRTWVGFRQAWVDYDREARFDGESKYTVRRLFRLALDGIFAFSDTPLKVISVAGLLLIGAAVVAWVAGSFGLVASSTGMTWLGSALLLLSGIQLISLGVVGEYVARIHRETRGRPLYLVQRRLGFRKYPRPVPDVIEFIPQGPLGRQEVLTAGRLRGDWQ